MLIGRDRELRAVTNAWRRRRRGVIVTGPPGMGRTAFADGVAALLQADGADVMRVRGTLTSRAVRLWALAPHLAASTPDLASERGRDLGDEVRIALAARASGRFAAVVDDAHLLDDASGRLLAQLLDTPNGFLVVTADDRHVEGPLLLHPALEPLPLTPLDAAGVARLLLARGAPDVDPTQALARSGGNPTAVLRWLLVTAVRGGADDSADDGIHAVLARLTPGARRALDMIAVAEPLSLASVATALDGDVRTAIDELVGTGLVEETKSSLDEFELRFVHPADAALVVELMAPLRVRSVVRRAVRAARTESVGRTPESLVRLAGLATRVGETLEPAQLRAATATARTGDDGDLALRLARCTAAATGEYDDVRVWADLAYERGAMDDLDAALSRLRVLADGADGEERTRRRTSLAVAESERALWRRADAAGALAALDAVLDGRTGGELDGSGVHELAALRGRVLATIGSTSDALDIAVPLLTHTDARVRAQAATAVCHARRRQGSPMAGIAALDDVMSGPFADDTVLLVSREVLDAVRSLALCEAGRWREAEQVAVAARGRADLGDDRAGRAVTSLVLAVAWCGRGRATPALATARRALELFEQLAQPAGVRWAWSVVGVAAGLAGDVAAGLTATDELRRLAPHPATLLPSMEPLTAAFAAMHTAPDQARRMLASAAGNLATRGDIAAAAQCLHELAVDGGASEALAALDTLALDGDEPLTSLRRDHVRALATDDHVALGDLARRFAEMGGDRWAVECAAAAAAAAARLGDRRAASDYATYAIGLAAGCEGLATSRLAHARAMLSGAVPLTARERDVAMLAARGMQSREIAERLELSVRTVDNHLARCFDKLGVRTRRQLAEVLDVDA